MSPGAATQFRIGRRSSSIASAAPRQRGHFPHHAHTSSTRQTEVTPMTKTAHQDLHSEHGARKGEHPGRSRNPVIKVHDLAWLEFEKPDLVRAEAFARAFGFTTVLRTDTELQLRGTDPGAPCVIIRRGATTRFRGMAFTAQDEADVLRLANATGAQALPLSDTIGGLSVDL